MRDHLINKSFQVLVTFIKNLIILNKTIVDGIASLAIPALLGIAITSNSETIRITGAEASWLCKYPQSTHLLLFSQLCIFNFNVASLTFIGHPFGSFLSGFVCDALGRRRALMLVMTPAIATFIMLGLAKSFWVVCLAFFALSFIFGLKDAPASVYISEIR